ncbi:hypothetical protein ABQ397_04105 [Serratia fonticola]|uniref:hypothetical protein n=1 Tax=Serratia fonticola TaxID=47917 RepID=UPI003AAE1CCD
MSSEGLPVNNVVGTSVDLGARSVQDAANSASSSQNADSAAASADAAWKFSRVAQGAAGESATAVSEAAAAAAAAAEAAQNATIAANLYTTLAQAQQAIDDELIPLNAVFNVAVPFGSTPPRFADQYQNVAGVATPTGVSYPSAESLNQVSMLINQQVSTDVAISHQDRLGRQAIQIDDSGIVYSHTQSYKYLITTVGDDGWVWKIPDMNGNVALGLDANGVTHGTFLSTTDPVVAVAPRVFSGLVVSPNEFEGATQHDRMVNAINFIERNGSGTLILGQDVISTAKTKRWILNSAMLLPSNITVYLDGSTLKLANGVFDNIIRNKGIVVDPANPNSYALALNESTGIKIIGSGVNESFIEGPDVPYTAPHPINGGNPVPWIGDWYGWRTIGILMANVKNYEIADVGIRKTTCWAISQERGCDNMHLHDIAFDTTVKNGDGIDFRMGCSNGLVENITGNTSDDTVAMTALLNFTTRYPSGSYIWPMQVSGDAPNPLGNNIENITIRGVKTKSLHNQVRVLLTNGAKINNISISSIEDTAATGVNQVFVQTGAYGAPSVIGDLTNVSVNGIVSNYSQNPLTVDVPIKDSQFNFIRQRKAGGNVYTVNTSYPVVNTTFTNAKAE